MDQIWSADWAIVCQPWAEGLATSQTRSLEAHWVEIAKSHVWKDLHTGIISTVHLLTQIQLYMLWVQKERWEEEKINNLNTTDN